MALETADRLPEFFKRLRAELGFSRLMVADVVRLQASVVRRAELGADARLSTWTKMFAGLGYQLFFDVIELDEILPDALSDEADARRERRWEGLCASRRRFL